MAFRILDFNRLELLRIAAQYPVINRAIKTAIAVARILLSAGASVTASIGKTDPVGKEMNDAMAAAYGLVKSLGLNPYRSCQASY